MRWLVFLFLVALRANAQSADALRAGTRVRLWERPSAELIGRVRSADATAITIDAADGPMVIEWQRVSHIEVSEGPRSGPRWKSGLIGGLAGAIGGGLLGVVIGNASNHNAPKFGAAGIGVGGTLGAIIGTTQPGERWDPVGTNGIPNSIPR